MRDFDREFKIVEQIIGAFFVRKDVFDKLSGFDKIFLYMDEVDFSLRLRKIGYQSFCCLPNVIMKAVFRQIKIS